MVRSLRLMFLVAKGAVEHTIIRNIHLVMFVITKMLPKLPSRRELLGKVTYSALAPFDIHVEVA